MNKLNKFMFVLFLAVLTAANIHAGDKIKIRLHQPPPNMLGVKELWKLDITNLTRENIRIYLTGTASESQKGQIVSGKSNIISIGPGTKTYSYDDFKSGEVNWKDKGIQEILLRTGNVAEGEYTICVTALFENGEVADEETCIEQTIRQMGDLTLISPENGLELDTKQPITFVWTPLPAGGTYTLRIVELKGDQSPETAIKEGRPVFEREGIKSSSYQYGLSDPKLEEGKKYVWTVASGSVGSGVSVFSLSNVCTSLQLDSITIACDDDSVKVYDYKIYAKNTCSQNINLNIYNPAVSASVLIPFNTGTNPPPANPPGLITTFSTSFPMVIAPGASVIITGTVNAIAYTGSQVRFYLYTWAGTTYNSPLGQSSISDLKDLMNCSKNCCENFVRKADSINVNAGSLPGQYLYSVNLTAGPNPIKKVEAEIVYFYQNWSDTLCKKCYTDSRYMGNFTAGSIAGFGTGALVSAPFLSTFSRDIEFNSSAGVVMTSGVSVALNLSLPPASSLSCCGDTLKLCIRFSFTDKNCNTCDTVICRKIIRNTSGVTNSAAGSRVQQEVDCIYIYESPEQMNSGEIDPVEENEKMKSETGGNETPNLETPSSSPFQKQGCGISGYVYSDLDGDGIYDIGTDIPLAGKTVTCVSTDAAISLTRVTNAAGWYSFQNTSSTPELGSTFPRQFVVTHTTPPPGWTETQPGTGVYSGVSMTINAFGSMIQNRNFGYKQQDTTNSQNCCRNFNMSANTTVAPVANNSYLYEISSNLTAGPRRIKKVRATMTYYNKRSSNTDCESCQILPLYNGSLLPELFSSVSNIPGLSGPTITSTLPLSLTVNANFREMVWGSTSGSGINMSSGVPVKLWLVLPPRSPLKCCADTINFCIKYTFTDTTCVTCDTVICSKIIRQPVTNNTFEVDPKKDLKKFEKDFNKYLEQKKKKPTSHNIDKTDYENLAESEVPADRKEYDNSDGVASGILGLDLDSKQLTKVTVFDLSGKEVSILYDAFLDKGKYSFDLNNYGLEDGTYYCKTEYGSEVRYETITVLKSPSSCNCGK